MEERELRLQQHRLGMAMLTIFNSFFQTGILALFAWVGTIPFWPVFAFVAASVGSTVFFASLIKFNINLRMKDKNLLTVQVFTNCLVQVVFLVVVPKLAVIFLVVLLVIFVYAAVQYTPKQFTVSWLVFTLITGIAIYSVRDRFAYPGTSSAEVAIMWLFFSFALRRLTLASSQYSSLRSKLSEKNAELKASLERINQLASHDDLTGCLNRRTFTALLGEELQRAGRTGQGFTFAILDLDHFKAVNDRYGHPAGDAALKSVVNSMTETLRVIDRFGRLGGEEFGVLLPATGLEQGAAAMERVRCAVRSLEWKRDAPGLKMTCSSGITVWRQGDTVESMIKRADDALYEAKHAGRDRVVSSTSGAALPGEPASV